MAMVTESKDCFQGFFCLQEAIVNILRRDTCLLSLSANLIWKICLSFLGTNLDFDVDD